MAKEQEIQNQIRLALSKSGMVFRTNAGEFWQGRRVYSHEFHCEILTCLRRVDGLPEGFPDLLYIGDGMTAFIEVKAPGGRVREPQERFLQAVKELHHPAGIARSVDDALNIIRREK